MRQKTNLAPPKSNKSLQSRLQKKNIKFYANDNIADHVSHEDLNQMIKTISENFKAIFDALGIDYKNDHNTQESALRIAKMWVTELFKGRYLKAPKLTFFPNINNYEQMVFVGPIQVKSVCAHHFVPIIGDCFIGLVPDSKLIGLSKYARIVDWICRRPQIQEEMTHQIAEFINDNISPKGVAVQIKAKHFCMACRGVNETAADTITSHFIGKSFKDSNLRMEFFQNISRS